MSPDRHVRVRHPVPRAAETRPPFLGRVIFHAIPVRRRVVLDNLRRVFGDALSERQIHRLAQAHYAHLARALGEIALDAVRTPAARAERVVIEEIGAMASAARAGRGVLLLTAHLGNWEVAARGVVARLPMLHGRLHFVRRPLPRGIDALMRRRFRRAGIGVIAKAHSLDHILGALAAGDAVVFPLDQHALGRDGIRVDFLGSPAATFRSLAIVARATTAPVVPVATWRAPDGRHVVRFDPPIDAVVIDDPDDWIRRATRAYNAALERMILRHPEQWFWVHRRWKAPAS